MEETMNEIQDGVDYTNIEDMAAEHVAERINVSAEEVLEHLDIDASVIAQYVDTYDIANNMHNDDIAREINISDVADEIDIDDLASYVADHVTEKIDVDYEEVANNMVMAKLAQEIDVYMIAALLCSSDKFAEKIPDAIQKALAVHDAKLTNVFQELADTLYNVVEERREVEE